MLPRQAIDAAPDKAVFHVNYANLLIAMQQFDAAREQLKISRSMDKLGVLASEIAGEIHMSPRIGLALGGGGARSGAYWHPQSLAA